MVFAWDDVDPALIRKLLKAFSQNIPGGYSAGAVNKLSDADLVRNAEIHLGRPLRKSAAREPAILDILRGPWLAAQSAPTVDAVIGMLSIGLRRRAPATKKERLAFIGGLNRTETLALELRRAFVAAHKVPKSVRSQPMSVGSQPARSAITLQGKGTPAQDPYPHQVEAYAALSAWAAESPAGAVIVLPTGAGKTRTAVTWLLDWLAQDDDRKVLWLAHQRELVRQAADTFATLAANVDAGFERQMRLITSEGSAVSTLVEPGLRVAVATMQSVRPGKDPKRAEALTRFTSSPTVVVVDEAHRAASDTYESLLDLLAEQPGTRILGLTATPTPSGLIARGRFGRRFPRTLIQVDPGILVEQGILAHPAFHQVETHVSVEMSPDSVRKALAADVPEDVLRTLAIPVRNRIIVEIWLAQPNLWMKTLVFATGIRHAEDLTRAFVDAGCDARVLHSQSAPSGDVLAWFRAATKPCVLVSVGMLTEGVDLPDAMTAFLTRPTTSAVLLRQMVGRVLRGPKAGGTVVAHLVSFHDDWVNFTGVLEPIDLSNLPESMPEESSDGPVQPSLRLVTTADDPIPANVLAQVRRLYSDHAAIAAKGSFVTTADLVGYYELSETRIPVFFHQTDSYEVLIADVLDQKSLAGRPSASYFLDDPLPHPAERSLTELVRETRASGESPPFVPCKAFQTPDAVAMLLQSSGAQTQEDRLVSVIQGWNDGGYCSFQSFEEWHEAVDAKLRDLSRRARGTGTVADPENVISVGTAPTVVRELRPLFTETVDRARDLLDSNETRDRLEVLPSVRWSTRPLRTTHAHWRWTAKAQRPVITVSRGLKVSPEHVSDELLRYLLWHELLHHVLPGHGHDGQFRRLEARWPAAVDLDRDLDTLHERIAMPTNQS